MDDKERAFQKRLLETFRLEALEHIQNISARLVEWEETGDPATHAALMETILREAHSLKGAARAVNLTEVESVCQAMENLLAALRRHELSPSPELFDLFHSTVETVSTLAAQDNPNGNGDWDTSNLIRRLQSALQSGARPAAEPRSSDVPPRVVPSLPVTPPDESPSPAHESTPLPSVDAVLVPPLAPLSPPRSSAEPLALPATVRVDPARLDALLLQSEELLASKGIAAAHSTELRELLATLNEWKAEWRRLSPTLRQLERVKVPAGERGTPQGALASGKLYDFLTWNSEFIQTLFVHLAAITRHAEQEQRNLGTQVDNLLDDARRVSMLPFSSLLEPIPAFVRQLARTQGKEVELIIEGGETEIDRRILDELRDPLIHLVRNSIDHGIEKPDARTRAGKPPRGTITIAISSEAGNQVAVRVSDDGAGVDLAQVRAAAIKTGLIPAANPRALPAEELRSLIFESGVSTSPIITDISGRGVGLAIVREKVQQLAGTVTVESEAGRGTIFRLLIPLNFAVFRGVTVREGRDLYIIPTRHIEHVLHTHREDIGTVENHETVQVEGRPVSIMRLAAVLGAELPPGSSDEVTAALLVSGERRIAFQVDEVLDEREVLLKGLGKQLARVRNIAGATVLADGRLVPVLDVPTLLASAIHAAERGPVRAAAPVEGQPEKKCILVAEDSITSRTLLRNILEGAGFEVEVAIDGMDALTRLRTRPFDAVVSDVDMPRLNGMELTERIRANPQWADMPVILVTALESRQDRERGIEVGANAYIVKSSFDQSNLIDVLQRLV